MRARAQELGSNSGVHPNLAGKIAAPQRYRPQGGDFVIENGSEFFNRSLYGGNTAFRVDGDGKPEFALYLPGRGGNLRLGVWARGQAKWLKDASRTVTRYRPGELIYDVRDAAWGSGAFVTVEALAYADTERLVVRARQWGLPADARLIWAYGGVNGQRGARDGDIGTEAVPISQYFQLQPWFTTGNLFSLQSEGFTLKSEHAVLAGITPEGTTEHVADAQNWDEPLHPLLDHGSAVTKQPIVVGQAPFPAVRALLLSIQG